MSFLFLKHRTLVRRRRDEVTSVTFTRGRSTCLSLVPAGQFWVVGKCSWFDLNVRLCLENGFIFTSKGWTELFVHSNCLNDLTVGYIATVLFYCKNECVKMIIAVHCNYLLKFNFRSWDFFFGKKTISLTTLQCLIGEFYLSNRTFHLRGN